MKMLHFILALLFCCIATGVCAVAAEGQIPIKIEMKGESAPPTLVVVQQDKNGGNQILEDVPEEYPAIIPYFLDYIQNGIEESGGDLQEKEASAIAITYSYPDNLEINLLSGEREKIVRKIKPDEKLHTLRIRSTMLMINFIKDETGNISSNAVIGFQLFPQGVDYAGMNIVPDYKIEKGSWTVIWEQTISVTTEIYQTTRATVITAIRTVLTVIMRVGDIVVIGRDGRIAHVVSPVWIYIGLRQEITQTVIPHLPDGEGGHRLCRCWNIIIEASPTQPERRIPCGQPFRVPAGEACSNTQGCTVCE
jgi:hypothetical protein